MKAHRTCATVASGDGVRATGSEAATATARPQPAGQPDAAGARVNHGFVSQSGKFDNVPVTWKSPTGTEQTYRVFQRTELIGVE